MSSSPSVAGTAGHAHAEDNKFWAYVQIAMLLAVITGVEIVAIGLPFSKTLLVTSLIVLSIVKFLFVIFYFMHLRWDKLFCTILFFIGLVLAGGTMWGLLNIFAVKDSRPLTAAEPEPTAAPAAPATATPAAPAH
jgi:cytochrome c oxidase subunit 4